jgi:hypothetical protein
MNSEKRSASYSPTKETNQNLKTSLNSLNVNSISDIKPNENIPLEEKEKPNFEPSGLLAKQTNLLK